MDEQAVFERFHEALELEPRPGAFERFRADFINPSVASKQRPVFRLRFSKMSLRMIAVATAAAVAIALVAGYVATHQHPPTSYVNAHNDANMTAYVGLLESDYQMNDFSSNHCATIQDLGCAAAVARVVPTLQKWVNDLNSFHTPPTFTILDAQLRAHLNQVIVDLNTAVRFQSLRDQPGFDLATGDALYQRGWLDPTTFTLEGTNQSTASSYTEAITQAKQSFDTCVQPAGAACLLRVSSHETCVGSGATTCARDVQDAESQVQNILIALARFMAPAPRAAQDDAFQRDLANVDSALLALTNAQLQRDAAKAAASEASYGASMTAATHDIDLLA